MEEYVIIPTYKEEKNLRVLLPLLKRYRVIIVDDGSEDGTEKLCKSYKNVRLIERGGKKGLSSAVMDGVSSIRDGDAKIVVADADFEHDYSKIPAVMKKLSTYGFVECVKVGKRPLTRRLISDTARLITRTAIPETGILEDPMSGFFGFRKSAVNLKAVRPLGYKIMLELFMNLKHGTKTAHVRYKYGKRLYGSSKLGPAVMADFILQTLRLNNYRVAYFLAIGAAGVVINEGLLAAFYRLTSLEIALIIAIGLSTLINFILNHFITFKRRSGFARSLGKFSIVSLFTLAINYFVAYYLSMLMFYLTANFIGIMAALVAKYSLSETYVWKTRS